MSSGWKYSRALELVLAHEGGVRLSLDPQDPGNWTGGRIGAGELRGTKFGISAAAYPRLDIANLTEDAAAAIYRRDYWDACRCEEMPWPVALVIFDAAVNQGPGTARRLLQACVGVRQDGDLGPRSMAAMEAMPPLALAREIQAQRLLRYTGTAGWSRFGLGWTRRAFAIMTEAARQAA